MDRGVVGYSQWGQERARQDLATKQSHSEMVFTGIGLYTNTKGTGIERQKKR